MEVGVERYGRLERKMERFGVRSGAVAAGRVVVAEAM